MWARPNVWHYWRNNVVKALKSTEGRLALVVEAAGHRLLADVPSDQGGDGLGPDPHDFFDAALAACTAMTVLMVAQRKGMPLDDVQVQISRDEDAEHYRMTRQLRLVGDLDAEQRSYLLGIANKCPIHRVLHKAISVETERV